MGSALMMEFPRGLVWWLRRSRHAVSERSDQKRTGVMDFQMLSKPNPQEKPKPPQRGA
jgi:hypothetical protein